MSAVECPTCGAPPKQLPPDPRTPLRCRYCGTGYERSRSDAVLAEIRVEITTWLVRTTGGESAAGPEAVDEATRSFLFNDRILPGLRREVRLALDEGVGDVEGSPLIVPPVLQQLMGFRAHDATLVTRRSGVLHLRRLIARLSAPEIVAFARTPADQAALSQLRAECERTMRLSNVACALAAGLRAGAETADENLMELEAEELPIDADQQIVVRASRARAGALRELLRGLAAVPADLEVFEAAAASLESTAAWLLSPERRSLRGALASTGIDRDATAVQLVAAVARAMKGTSTPLVTLLDGLGHLASLLLHVERPRDAAPIVHSWAVAVAARNHGAPVPVVADTSWVADAVRIHFKGATLGRVAPFAVPYWVFPLRHTRAEGFFLVSGKQQSGFVFVPASASPEGLLIGDRDVPWVAAALHAIEHPCPTELQLDLAVVGPLGCRLATRAHLLHRGLKNVTLGEAKLVYLPLCVTELTDAKGERSAIPLLPAGRSPHLQNELLARLDLLSSVVSS